MIEILDSITDKDVEYLTLCLQQFEKESLYQPRALSITNGTHMDRPCQLQKRH